ncbi:hypothetical protein MNBD_IGNAVI01-1531, partial [hydrothermal vent metagenome]
MKKYLKIIFANIFIISLFGCEDVIVVDLNSTAPRIVIEGEITNRDTLSIVRITKSTDFYQPGVYDKVSGADIVITDSEGKSSTLTEVEDGLYQTNSIKGKSGTIYNITVKAEGKIYQAESTMPRQVNLDSLSIEVAPYPPGGGEEEKRYFLHLYFQDPPDIDNYCRFKIFNNGEQLGGFYIYFDKFTNGNNIDYRLVLHAKKNNIKLGDSLMVELQSIDKASFDFYKTAN